MSDCQIKQGDVWICDESRAESLPEPWDRPHDAAGIAEYARFRIHIDTVAGEYIEATVGIGNSHPRTPAQGAEIVTSPSSLREKPRWSEK